MVNRLITNILPKQQLLVFEFLCTQEWLKDFFLAGGTALALLIGHRESVDFDFFTVKDFNPKELISCLQDYGTFELFTESSNTLHGVINGVQISFFKLKDGLIAKAIKHEKLVVASPHDIGAMKLNAISGRGSKKDFVDLYFILKSLSLKQLFENYEVRYGQGVANNYHLLKSLVYFEDAEKQPMPKMHVKVSWQAIKDDVILQVKEAVKNLEK